MQTPATLKPPHELMFEMREFTMFTHVGILTSSWIRTKEAVDESKQEAERADDSRDDLIFHINLKSTDVHVS